MTSRELRALLFHVSDQDLSVRELRQFLFEEEQEPQQVYNQCGSSGGAVFLPAKD